MFKIFKLGIHKKGIVTTKYPAEAYKPFDETKGLPVVDAKKCSHIGTCAKVCPTSAILVSKESVTIDIGLCIFCGNCALACPNKAIKLTGEIELSTRKKDNLKVTF
jgi:formate hydrogenlyase subunit 6/NADH:ubiquinone oxidoreductase subunit I